MASVRARRAGAGQQEAEQPVAQLFAQQVIDPEAEATKDRPLRAVWYCRRR